METEVDSARAAEHIESGDSIVVDTSSPKNILAAIAERDDLENVDVYAYGYPYRERSALAALATTPGIHLTVSMVPSMLRDLVADGTVTYLPRPLYDAAMAPFIGDANRRRVTVLQLPKGEDDRLRCIGCTSTFAERAIADADVVLAETNPRLPAARPERNIRCPGLACSVPVDRTPPLFEECSVEDTYRSIATHLVDVLPDYPTVQLGLSTVGVALGSVLAESGPVDVWSGLVSESTRRLVDSGAARTVDAAVAVGRHPDFYEWFREQEVVRLGVPDVIYSRTYLDELSNFVAINSALQVDLTGAVNAESIDGRHLGGIGGQAEFMHAASHTPDGLAVIAMPSRTSSGDSRIFQSIASSDPVTTPRSAVDLVVTENGVADLRDHAASERASALIDVAHPESRDVLQDEFNT